MKYPILLLFIALTSFKAIAQDTIVNNKKFIKKFHKELNLSDKQKKEFSDIDKKYSELVLAIGKAKISKQEKIEALITMLEAKDKDVKAILNDKQFQTYIKYTQYQKQQLYMTRLQNNEFHQNMISLNLSEDQKNKYLKIITEYGIKIKKINSEKETHDFDKQLKIQAIVTEQHEKMKTILNAKQFKSYRIFFKEQLEKNRQ